MRRLMPGVLAAAIVLGLGQAASVGAAPVDRNPNSPGNGWGPPATRGAPGPLAGVGLPILLIVGAAGAYRVIRNRNRRRETDLVDRR